jgi:hypothetical protein
MLESSIAVKESKIVISQCPYLLLITTVNMEIDKKILGIKEGWLNFVISSHRQQYLHNK